MNTKKRDYWIDLYGDRGSDFVKGVKAGIGCYAWWKDGVQHVGTTGKTLKTALREVDEAFGVEEKKTNV